MECVTLYIIDRSFGYTISWEGYDCYVMNVSMMGSKGFGEMFSLYPICIGYIFDGTQYTVSLYSEQNNIDVSKICQKYGGGGHKGAAGFNRKELPFKL